MENDFLARSYGEFPGATEHLKRLSCLFVFFFSDEIFQTKPSLTPVPRLRGRFSVNETDLYKW